MGKLRLDSLQWDEDRIKIGEVSFLVHDGFEPPALDADTFWLFKGPELLHEYFDLFRRHPDLDVRNIFELGVWESGSVAFWSECFQPVKHAAIDLAAPREPKLFKRYLAQEGRAARVRTYWQTDQADERRLLNIVRREFDGPLDLVIDDASHLLRPTTASLACLFPLLREGGLFIVEDWGWHLVPEVRAAFSADEPGLVPLINALLPLLPEQPALLRNLDISDRLFAVERGAMDASMAREILRAKLSPQYSSSPAGLRRLIRASPVWPLVRSTALKLRRRTGSS